MSITSDDSLFAARQRYDTRHGALILFSLETYNLYSIASQLKRLFDPMTIGISHPGIFEYSLGFSDRKLILVSNQSEHG